MRGIFGSVSNGKSVDFSNLHTLEKVTQRRGAAYETLICDTADSYQITYYKCKSAKSMWSDTKTVSFYFGFINEDMYFASGEAALKK